MKLKWKLCDFRWLFKQNHVCKTYHFSKSSNLNKFVSVESIVIKTEFKIPTNYKLLFLLFQTALKLSIVNSIHNPKKELICMLSIANVIPENKFYHFMQMLFQSHKHNEVAYYCFNSTNICPHEFQRQWFFISIFFVHVKKLKMPLYVDVYSFFHITKDGFMHYF